MEDKECRAWSELDLGDENGLDTGLFVVGCYWAFWSGINRFEGKIG